MRTKIALILILGLIMGSCVSAQKKLERERARDPRHQYNLGLFYMNNGQVNEAILHLQRALSLNPRYALALNALGQAYWMKGSVEDSVRYFQECLNIDPTMSEAHNNLGVSYQELGLLDKAGQEFQKAASDPSYKSREMAYYNLARLYFLRDKIPQALSYTQKSLEINGTFVMALNLKGMLEEKQGNLQAAITSYRQGLRYAPGDVNLKFNLAVAYFKNNEHKKAEEIFTEVYPNVADRKMREKIDEYLALIRKAPLPYS